MNWNLMTTNYGKSVAVVLNGELKTADDSHPAFDDIVEALERGDDPSDLFDVESAVRNALFSYSSRVEVVNGRVEVDGYAVGGGLAEVILTVLNEGLSAEPYVRFLENVADNPSHRSRTQLYDYLDKHGFQITEDGCFISYKGISADGKSVSSGTAFVNGNRVVGRIPNSEGDVITMPRSQVSDDPNIACHQGLHAGAWGYASTFGSSGCTLKVKINPRDVVSVPADSNQQKLRTCRYEVLEVTTEELPESIYYTKDELDAAYDDGYADGQSDLPAWY